MPFVRPTQSQAAGLCTALFAASVFGPVSGTGFDATASAEIIDVYGLVNVDPSNGFDISLEVDPIQTNGASQSFTSHLRAYNTYTGQGGVAQTHVRRLDHDLYFTIVDDDNLGYTLDATSLVRSYATLELTGGSRGDVTGVSFLVSMDDSSDAPDTFTNVVALYGGTGGTTVTNPDGLPYPLESSKLDEVTKSTELGTFVGTRDFVIRFSNWGSPTTNVFFQNGATGTGTLNLGFDPNMDTPEGVSPDDLGHFVTVTATPIPEPASIALLGLGALCFGRRRRK